jgi:hypothetical protein
MNDSFSEKFNLILKVLSISRARVAAELGVNKSVVARWASGATVPSSHNLAGLSALLARTIPGFTALDWDRDLDSLAEFLGVGASRGAPTPSARALPLPFLDQVVATTALRGPAYEGFYRSTRPYAAEPGRFIHDHSLVRIGADGLLQFRMITAGVVAEGWILAVLNQLFIIGAEFTGGAYTFAILHGVNGVKCDVLDGITLTSIYDVGRSPAATPVVYHRIGELTGDPATDDARLRELAAPNPVAPEGSVPEDLRNHLVRDIGPSHAALGGDWVLHLPLARALSRGPAAQMP